MGIQQFMCPRIRLTQTDGNRAIISVDLICGFSEDKRAKCVHVNTVDGFSYEVVNSIVEVDKKIDEAIAKVNGSVPIVIQDTAPIMLPGEMERYENSKTTKVKKRMLSAGIDKPARRVASLEQGDTSDTPTPPPAFVENENPEKVEQNDATGDAQKSE